MLRTQTPLSLRRRRVGTMDTAGRTGANLDYVSTLTPVRDNRLGHLLAGFLNGREFSACAVHLGFLDLQLHVLIPPQRSALASVPCRRNLYKLRLAFERLRDGGVDLGPEAQWVGALCGIKGQGELWGEGCQT